MLSRHEGLHNGGGTVSALTSRFQMGGGDSLERPTSRVLRATEDYKLLARAWQAASKKGAKAGVDHLGPARPFFLRNYAVVAN